MLRQKEKITAKKSPCARGRRGIAVFFAIIVLISSFTFSASAELVLDGFQYNAQGLSFNDITIYLVDSQGNQTELTTGNSPISVGNGIACWVSVPDKLVFGTWYDLVIELHADSYIADPDLYTVVEYRSTVDVTKFDCIGVGDCYRWGTGGKGPDQKATTQAWSNNYNTGYIIKYPANGPKTVYEYYHSSIRIRPKETFTGLTVYIQDVTVKTYTEEEKNTQAIIDNEKELQENEKNEANSTGQDGIDEITSAIPDYSQFLVTSFNNLTSFMRHNETDCILTVPSLSIPSVGGYFDKITLMDEIEIDMEYYINLIPESIMLLIRAVLSSGLIIFCLKELYEILEYIMTLRGKSNV